MLFRVSISARKVGAIGQHGAVKRVYEIESPDRSRVTEAAINRAYMDGDIETCDGNEHWPNRSRSRRASGEDDNRNKPLRELQFRVAILRL